MKKENEYQAKLIKRLKERYKGCLVLKNDPNYIQGIPDLLILYKNKWAGLECKRNKNSSHRPNQDFYVGIMNEMSYCSFITEETEEAVFIELDVLFGEE